LAAVSAYASTQLSNQSAGLASTFFVQGAGRFFSDFFWNGVHGLRRGRGDKRAVQIESLHAFTQYLAQVPTHSLAPRIRIMATDLQGVERKLEFSLPAAWLESGHYGALGAFLDLLQELNYEVGVEPFPRGLQHHGPNRFEGAV
jgi:hypothetical protein